MLEIPRRGRQARNFSTNVPNREGSNLFRALRLKLAGKEVLCGTEVISLARSFLATALSLRL